MELVKTFSRRSLWIVIVFQILLTALVATGYRLGLGRLSQTLSPLAAAENASGQLISLASWVTWLENGFWWPWLPVLAAVFLVTGVLTWLFCRGLLKGLARKVRPSPKARKAVSGEAAPSKKQQRQSEHRLFLHLLALFQREGRLLDFFAEDLNLYQDEQIGAAVRSIHAGCCRALDKALAPQAVLDQPEGSEITVKRGFDPGAVKLTGNVTGDPPFKGLLRHKGWRAKRLDLPALTETTDPGIIAPAEVEIL